MQRVSGRGLAVQNDFLMNGLHAAQGIELFSARIGGTLGLDGAQLSCEVLTATSGEKTSRPAIWAENASVGGNANLRGVIVEGCVQFMNARVGGNLECRELTITLSETRQGNALWLERAKVSGHVLLGPGPMLTATFM